MGKLVISTNVSVDGVVQDPDGKEGFRLGGWFGRFGGKDLEQWAKVEFDEALDTEALLLGRRSDEWFAERWLSRSDEWAARLNSLPNTSSPRLCTMPAGATRRSSGATWWPRSRS